MPRISITNDALRELRERLAHCRSPSGVSILGPLEGGAWPADDLEEAWLVEKLYGPHPRWVLHVMPLEAFSESFHVEEVCGIHVEVLTQGPIPRLSVELQGDAIRVHEVDA